MLSAYGQHVGFLLVNASASVVSQWGVDDESTAALMSIKYKHLAQDFPKAGNKKSFVFKKSFEKIF